MLILTSFAAWGDTLTLQQGLNGFSGFSDTYVVMSTDSTPSLSSELVVEGYHCSACIDERALLRIDLSTIDKNRTISKAELQLYSPSQPRAGAGVVEAYTMTRTWVDSSANWFNATPGVKWTKAGGDYLTAATATLNYGTQINVWHKLDVTKAVKEFVADPASNLGFMLKLDPAMLTVTYVSSQGAQEKRPKLVIAYSAAGVIDSRLTNNLSRPKIGIAGSGINFAFSDNGSHHIRLARLNGEKIIDRIVQGASFVFQEPAIAHGTYVTEVSDKSGRLSKEIFISR